ncbi:MAG: methionine--tRNA ligase [Candidatus Eremiobacteraeota bacterium]|nr:methionine--tRNA ligase [Candidatus Eremiobacteraeota bacterium]
MTRGFYVTTPIYYINGNPHIGHAYTTIVADVLARTARTRGDAFFLTGTDEHGQKVADAAKAAGLDPQTWCDRLVPKWKQLFASFHVEYDDFIRTTEPRHERLVQRVFERLRENGDVYRGVYEGWYCSNDETFWLESKLIEGRCPNPECRREVEWLSEESWFFRLSKYNQPLLEHFRTHPNWVRPRSAYNEMMSMLEEGLEDFSISRAAFDWGIPIPGGGGVIYVWFDALLNYITALGWSEDDARFRRYWPATVQLIGKEIARFHTIIWPAILWSLGEKAPDLVFAHGWITLDGQKIGKSLGNAVDPETLVQRFGADAIRYFLLREGHFGSDFSYSEAKIAQRYNDELGNDLGNLVRRTLTMLARYRNGLVPQPGETRFGERFTELPKRVEEAIFNLQFRDALEEIWELVSALNREIDERKPWVLAKAGDEAALDALLYDLCEGIRWLAVMLAPFMPQKAGEIWEQLGLRTGLHGSWEQTLVWGGLGAQTQTAPSETPLFPRLEIAVA